MGLGRSQGKKAGELKGLCQSAEPRRLGETRSALGSMRALSQSREICGAPVTQERDDFKVWYKKWGRISFRKHWEGILKSPIRQEFPCVCDGLFPLK